MILDRPHILASGDSLLRKKIAAHLVTNYHISLREAKQLLPQQLSFWGKLKKLDGGDMIHAKDTTRYADLSRNATFVKV